jgi:DNA-binding beta-propeller fold protein YncE
MFLSKSRQGGWQRWAGVALSGLLCLTLVSTAAAQSKSSVRAKKKAEPLPQVDINTLVWPQPPQQPRIRFVTQVVGQRDLQGVKRKKAGFLEKAAGIEVSDAELPHLQKPYGVAVDSKGLIYVADSGQKMVFVFDLEKKTLSFRGDKPPAHIKIAIGVAIDDKDRLFVSDAAQGLITLFDVNGKFITEFGGGTELQRPAGMAVDSELRRLYVADVKAGRIAIYDLDTLKLVRYIEAQKPNADEPHGFLAMPTNVAVDADGLLYVVDTIINRIEIFDSEGDYLEGFGEQGSRAGTFARPKGIAVDTDGHIYVADDEFNNFQIFSPKGDLLLAVGSYGSLPGQFHLLTGLAADTRNRIIATDSGPSYPRIEVFRYTTDAEAADEASKEAAKSGAKTGAR